MSISNHSRSKKALAKAVQRKEKARRLRFERSHRKQPLSTAQFAKEFVSEALDLLKKKEDLKKELKEKVASIRVLRETDPTKYAFLSSDSLDSLLTSFDPLDASIAELNNVAAKLEDTNSSTEKMHILLDSTTVLADAQAEMMRFFDKYLVAIKSIDQQIKEVQEGVTNENTIPDAVFEEERTHEDQEIDVSEEDVKSV